jgi:hypothetical protein
VKRGSIGFALFDELPEGWKFDKSAGSPLHGYEFATDGKSVLRGGKRALVRVLPAQRTLQLPEVVSSKMEQSIQVEEKPIQVIDSVYVQTVNELARQKFKYRLLNDIMVDLTICEIEGWCKKQYINELRDLINGLGQQACIDG